MIDRMQHYTDVFPWERSACCVQGLCVDGYVDVYVYMLMMYIYVYIYIYMFFFVTCCMYV